MNNDKLLEVINQIREKAYNNKLVIFVGSGVSKNTKGMSSWYDIIDRMAKSIDYSRCDYCDHKTNDCTKTCTFARDYSTDEFLRIPQYAFNKNKNKYNDILKECIAEPVDSPFASAIFELYPAHIITTNYDGLLEASKHEYRKRYELVIQDKDLLCSDKCKYIIKMHGDLNHLDTIVLKEQDYLEYSQKHVLMELFIKSLLIDHTFLFIGYSLNDYNIKLILSWLNYMRSENNVFEKNHKVGYIVLGEALDKTRRAYYSKNNIGVIEIDSIPLVSGIHESITSAVGKRLYSFLRFIADPSLDYILSKDVSMNYVIEELQKYAYIPFKSLRKILSLKTIERKGEVLEFFDESAFIRIKECLDDDNSYSKELKRILVNSGIEKIKRYVFEKWPNYEVVTCGDFEECDLFKDELFKLYLNNKYYDLQYKLKTKKNDSIERCFYYSIIEGYTKNTFELKNDKTDLIRSVQKLSWLYNDACLNTIKTLSFNPIQIKRYVDSITNQIEKEICSSFIELCNGYDHDQLIENESYNQIVSSGNISISNDFYKAKNIAVNYYCFFFYNHLFFKRFSDLPSIFKPYISIVLYYSNISPDGKSVLYNKDKYELTKVDIDILSKFISTKNLYAIIDEFAITRLNVSEKNKEHIVACFCNLSKSLYDYKIFGCDDSVISALSNLVVFMNRVDLSKESISLISRSVKCLFSSADFIKRFFSLFSKDFKYSLRAFSELMPKLENMTDFNIVKSIVADKDFFNYAVNVRFNMLRTVVSSFVGEDDQIQDSIKEMIDSEDRIQEKIVLLRLLYKHINDKEMIKKYKKLLSDNYEKLSTNALYDFVFSKWIRLSESNIDYLFKDIISSQKYKDENEANGIRIEPDPVDSRLESIYILYLCGLIKDLSPLAEISVGKPHLQFLLKPDDFDYSTVDFSNYMWLNFAHNSKLMRKFIDHKAEIAPKLIGRYKTGSITEDEKKILIKYIIDEDELWKL